LTLIFDVLEPLHLPALRTSESLAGATAGAATAAITTAAVAMLSLFIRCSLTSLTGREERSGSGRPPAIGHWS
jgi:hypothetical protein